MRTISQTSPPPVCLGAQPAHQEWGAFMQTPCHGTVADRLRGEQNHLCCYCERCITQDRSHIEHVVPRSRCSVGTYDYTNLAASCSSRTGQDSHCGHRKAGAYDAARFVSPHSQAAGGLFAYGIDGGITPADPLRPDAAKYMRDLLGLDCPSLTGRRRDHARLLIRTLGEQPTPDLIACVRSLYLTPDASGRLRQFVSLSRALLT